LNLELSWNSLEAEVRGCVRCQLACSRCNVVVGVGRKTAELMLIGEAPGGQEDQLGQPFVGRSGWLLDKLLEEELGIDRYQCYITNVVKCRPPKNRNPLPEEIASCRGFLERQIDLVSPKVIVTLGNVATKAILARREGITTLRGVEFSWRGISVVPTYHPAAALRRGERVVDEMRADLRLVGEVLVRKAVQVGGW
jgi:uracil-DNA glycosylase family 4